MEKKIQDDFSQSWEIFRVATHEKGGLHLIADMDTKYSLKQLYDMIEVLDVYDSMKQAAQDKALAENKNK
ncbi:MAG: hypothetical protein ACRC6V_01745 [Bacteroidales bacterium]